MSHKLLVRRLVLGEGNYDEWLYRAKLAFLAEGFGEEFTASFQRDQKEIKVQPLKDSQISSFKVTL